MLVEDMSRNECFFLPPGSNITCFTSYSHLRPIYWRSRVHFLVTVLIKAFCIACLSLPLLSWISGVQSSQHLHSNTGASIALSVQWRGAWTQTKLMKRSLECVQIPLKSHGSLIYRSTIFLISSNSISWANPGKPPDVQIKCKGKAITVTGRGGP
jgi:hypothetical protein